MPIHDWTRVTAGTWHAFHLSWLSEIQEALNTGVLPSSYYAQAEQIAGPLGPDVLTLQVPDDQPLGTSNGSPTGGIALAVAPPKGRHTDEGEMNEYLLKRRTIVVRHASGDRIVAFLEIVSPGNKGSRHAVRTFVEKAVEALFRGFHLLIVDLFPPGPRDPDGMHPLIWSEFGETSFRLPPDEPLTLAAYSAGPLKRAFVEPTAVGRPLEEMALFLEPELYVNVPLERTYQAAYRGVPRRWQAVLDHPRPST